MGEVFCRAMVENEETGEEEMCSHVSHCYYVPNALLIDPQNTTFSNNANLTTHLMTVHQLELPAVHKGAATKLENAQAIREPLLIYLQCIVN